MDLNDLLKLIIKYFNAIRDNVLCGRIFKPFYEIKNADQIKHSYILSKEQENSYGSKGLWILI